MARQMDPAEDSHGAEGSTRSMGTEGYGHSGCQGRSMADEAVLDRSQVSALKAKKGVLRTAGSYVEESRSKVSQPPILSRVSLTFG